MKDNMELKVEFVERGKRKPAVKIPSEPVLLSAPDYTLPREYRSYEHTRYFTYELQPDMNIEEEYTLFYASGKPFIVTKTPISGKTPISAYAVFSGYEITDYFGGLIGCKVYALSSQWLITSAKCPWYTYSKEPVVLNGKQFTLTDRKITKVKLDDMPVRNMQAFQNNHLLLLHIPQEENQTVISVLQSKTPLKVLAFSKPRKILSLTALGKFFTHTARGGLFMFFDKQALRINSASVDGWNFAARSRFNATATDPVFLAYSQQEYLCGYSAAEETYALAIDLHTVLRIPWHGENSDQYYMLNKQDLHFIHNTVCRYDDAFCKQLPQYLFVDQPLHLHKSAK